MSTTELQKILTQLNSTKDYSQTTSLLSKAKLQLLKLSALTPSPSIPPATLALARSIFEHGALTSIQGRDADAFVRYVHQLQPFYDLPASLLPAKDSQKSKITGLYLLLLLTKGDYAGFHTELEGLEGRGEGVGGDVFLEWPVRLERWLMEGSYDRVWRAIGSGKVPSVEYGVFSEVCLNPPPCLTCRISVLISIS
jgi:26S proteasome regulatory subunit N12